ncbi:hypothetical protein TNCT_544631 [Trichonephila clavata]|uniref:Uncharacterized protein n=1 Tax=Trichonephila clavata TaxID=2740835 RepID=A0A8X6H1V9_TRICU|nr:hypothetical protein TNCT_544631 [Trichonephila clavata]
MKQPPYANEFLTSFKVQNEKTFYNNTSKLKEKRNSVPLSETDLLGKENIRGDSKVFVQISSGVRDSRRKLCPKMYTCLCRGACVHPTSIKLGRPLPLS